MDVGSVRESQKNDLFAFHETGLLRFKCTKFDFVCGSHPEPTTLEAYCAPRDCLWLCKGNRVERKEGQQTARGGVR